MEKNKVVFLVRGTHGLGHITPAIAIAEELAFRGIDTHFLTYGAGLNLLKSRKFKHVYDVGEPNHTKGVVPWKDLFEVTKDVLPLIQKIKPKITIVDGECDALFLLKPFRTKLVFLTTPSYIDLNYGPWKEYADYGKAGLQLPDKILVHGISKPSSKRVKYVFLGPLVRKNTYKIRKNKQVTIVLGTSVSTRVKKYGYRCCSFLRQSGYESIIINPTIRTKRIKEPLKHLSVSSLIILHGGMALLEEAAVLGKPAIVLFDHQNEEKRRNALIAEKLGICESIDVSKPFDGKSFLKKFKKVLAQRSKSKPRENGLRYAVQELQRML